MIPWIVLSLIAGAGDAVMFAVLEQWWLAAAAGLGFGAAAGLVYAEGWRRGASIWQQMYEEEVGDA